MEEPATERLILWHRLASRRDGSDPGLVSGWVKGVRARLVAAGGRVLAQISGTVVAEFDDSDAADVLEVSLDLLSEADEAGHPVAIGIAFGPVAGGTGRAVELAELLATRAQAGEIVLDPAARDRVEGLFLFARQVSTGTGGPRGAAIDRTHPRRDACAEGLAKLGPLPLGPPVADLLDTVVRTLDDPGAPVVVLRGPAGAGAMELVREAAVLATPRLVLRIAGAPGAVVPLASLRYALGRAVGRPEALAALVGSDEEGRHAVACLGRVMRGEVPPRGEVASALGALLRRTHARQTRRRAWLFLTPLAMMDAASLEAVLGAREHGASFGIVARYPLDARLPPNLGEPVRDLLLPPLRTSDARAVAEGILGPATDGEIARKVAVLGGETSLGVLEVARGLIASGDLVLVGEGYEWRGSPRGGVSAMPLDEVVTERLERLDDEARRMLEIVCAVPDGSTRALLETVAAADGMPAKAQARGLGRLEREAWLSPAEPWVLCAEAAEIVRPSAGSAFVRRLVLTSMPPARHGELHRFVADALLAQVAGDPALVSLAAEAGWYEIEGGREKAGAARLAEAAQAVAGADYRRAAGRLAQVAAGAPAAAAVSGRATATLAPPALDDEPAPPPTGEISIEALAAAVRPAAVPKIDLSDVLDADSLGAEPLDADLFAPAPRTETGAPQAAGSAGGAAVAPAPERRSSLEALLRRSTVPEGVLVERDEAPDGGLEGALAAALASEAARASRHQTDEETEGPPTAEIAIESPEASRATVPGTAPGASSTVAGPTADAPTARQAETTATTSDPASPAPEVATAKPSPAAPTATASPEPSPVTATASDPASPTDERTSGRTSSAPAPAGPLAQAAQDAIRSRDLDAIDAVVARAVASGTEGAAVARVRALAELLRGDVDGARRALALTRKVGARLDARGSIAEAAIALKARDPSAAIRFGLWALAVARRTEDRRGEVAALCTMAACYRALGREEQAARIEARAG